MTGPSLPIRLRSLVRRSTPVVAHRSGISRAIAQRYRGRGVIFMLHSVVDDDAFYPEATLRCPVGRLDWILRWLKANDVDLVSLDEAIARLGQPQSAPPQASTGRSQGRSIPSPEARLPSSPPAAPTASPPPAAAPSEAVPSAQESQPMNDVLRQLFNR